MFRFSLQSIWDLTIHPLENPASSLAHLPVSSSDIICNSSSPPLANIFLFKLSFLSPTNARSNKKKKKKNATDQINKGFFSMF